MSEQQHAGEQSWLLMRRVVSLVVVALAVASATPEAFSQDAALSAEAAPGRSELKRIDSRYAEAAGAPASDIPDFRRHVVPLMGRLGCNGRACHGAFQGQGGFRLSLFGYDFEADYENLMGGDEPRINTSSPFESLALLKPLEEEPHDGGQRLERDTWQLRVLEQWIRGGAEGVTEDTAEFVRLEVEPKELLATEAGEQWNLRAVGVWSVRFCFRFLTRLGPPIPMCPPPLQSMSSLLRSFASSGRCRRMSAPMASFCVACRST